MDRTEPHVAPTATPVSPRGRPGPAMPACIAAILGVVRVLLGYGKHLDRTLPDRVSHPRFPALAAGFGTHDLSRILAHVQRGILRAMMLQRFLLARAAQGREIEPAPPPVRAEQEDIAALEIKLRAPSKPRRSDRWTRKIVSDDPMHFAMPTLQELESQVRRRSVGRTISDICMDLGIDAIACDGAFWQDLYRVLITFGGKHEDIFNTQERRRKAFLREPIGSRKLGKTIGAIAPRMQFGNS